MPFRLANALATFQLYIYRALRGLLNQTCVVYLDNILVYLENLEYYNSYVKEVLNYLVKQGLFIKVSKCSFLTESVKFLGFIITPKGVVIDLEQVRTITEQPEPKGYKDIQVFLSFANFYRRFVYNYLGIVQLLVDYITAAQNLELD